MDAAAIQSKVYLGYAKAAQFTGASFAQYRPTGLINPVAGSPLQSIMAAFTPHNQSNFGFAKPADFKSPLFHAMLDGSQVQIGDYLIGASGTYFIMSLDPLQPPLACLCNRVISIGERAETTGEGIKAYGGETSQTATPIAKAWPVSALKAARAVTERVLPGDDGFGSYEYIMPLSMTAQLQPAMVITDDLANNAIIQIAEKSTYGWRVTAKVAIV